VTTPLSATAWSHSKQKPELSSKTLHYTDYIKLRAHLIFIIMTQVQKLRGIQSFETGDNMMFVQTPITKVGEVFDCLYSGRWERDVYGRELQDVSSGFIFMQFRGHPWTIISELLPYYSKIENDAQSLSHLLNTRTICYYISDTSGEFSYKVYQAGTCVEQLFYGYNVGFQFESQLRLGETIREPHVFVDTFFRQQDIYVPVLFSNLSRGKQINKDKIIIKLYKSTMVDVSVPVSHKSIPMFDHSDFERVDFFELEQGSANVQE